MSEGKAVVTASLAGMSESFTVTVVNKDAYTWAFVGNPFDGFSVVNRAAGATMVLSSPKAPTGNTNAEEKGGSPVLAIVLVLLAVAAGCFAFAYSRKKK